MLEVLLRILKVLSTVDANTRSKEATKKPQGASVQAGETKPVNFIMENENYLDWSEDDEDQDDEIALIPEKAG